MHQANAKWFKDPRLVQLFDRYATYNGSDPYQVPATLNVIPHLEHNIGAFFPEKGMYNIVSSLYNLAVKMGIRFRMSTRVDKVLVSNNKVSGIEAGGEKLSYDSVISAIDVHHFYKNLLPDQVKLRKIEDHQRSTSALIFYWGINRQFPDLQLHNILFSKDYHQEFNHLHKGKSIFSDPTVYIFISSKAVKSDAPEGCENWFVMINVPENMGQDWDSLIIEARQYIILKINRLLGTNIDSLITQETILDPRGIESRTSSYRGSLYGTSSNSKFAAFARHPNFSNKIKGLYFTGGSVHPGGGIPLCLASAKIVSSIIERKGGE
jgi:phytoene desaturase